MPTIRLTKAAIDRLPTPAKGQRIDYFDTQTRGLGLRVSATTKTFFAKADVQAPGQKKWKTVRKTLGRYGEITLDEARRLMAGRTTANGEYIPGARLALKQAQAAAVPGHDVTLKALLALYFQERRTRSGKPLAESTRTSYQGRINRHFGNWLELTLPEIAKISPDVIFDLHHEITIAHGPMEARNAIVALHALLGHGRRKYPAALPQNPVSVITQTGARVMAPISPRQDYLATADDFRKFLEGLESFNEVTRDCYLLCLFHGLRAGEAHGLKWAEVDFDRRLIHIDDTKNRQPLIVPFSRQSLEILQRRREGSADAAVYVFGSEHRLNKAGHVRLSAEKLSMATGLKLTVHGLRRTFSTHGRKLKLFADVDRLTNHVDRSITGRFYDMTDVDDLRRPLQIIADHLDRLLNGIPVQVVPIAQGAS